MDARLIARRLLPQLLLLWLALWSGSALSQVFDHEHEIWDGLLKKHVVVLDGGRASQLRYAGMAQDHAALKDYLEKISAVKDAEFDRWARPLQEEFLINAYNAFTVEKVLSRYPDIKSIWDFGKLFGNPFKDRFFTLLGKKTSLDDIEHGLLRKNYREPRAAYFARYARLLSDAAAGQNAIAQGKAALGFLEYDWALNDARK
jgi:hypothetical protein